MLRKVILIFVLVVGSIFIYRSTKFIDDKYLNYPPFQVGGALPRISTTRTTRIICTRWEPTLGHLSCLFIIN